MRLSHDCKVPQGDKMSSTSFTDLWSNRFQQTELFTRSTSGSKQQEFGNAHTKVPAERALPAGGQHQFFQPHIAKDWALCNCNGFRKSCTEKNYCSLTRCLRKLSRPARS